MSTETDSRGIDRGNERPRRLVAELSHMVQLRRELAAIEIAHDRRLLTRGAIVVATGMVMALAGLPLLLQATAHFLAANTQLSATTWSVIIGTILVVPGTIVLVGAMRKMRREFCGLRGTMAELNEDLIWLREWTAMIQEEAANADRSHTP